MIQACDEPIQDPIVGTWEGDSENQFGLVIHNLKIEDDGTYTWRQSYIGLKGIFEERNPDMEWGELGFVINGEFTIAEDEIVLSPQDSELFHGSDAFGGWPVFEKGYDYVHPYHFEGADLIMAGDADEPITFKRQ